MAATSSLYGGGGGIKSIQRGTTAVTVSANGVAASTTATINAVDLSKSFISATCRSGWWGSMYFSTSYGFWSTNIIVGATLTNTTTVTFNANGYPYYPNNGGTNYMATNTPTGNPTIYWEVIEYE